jgi:uncharacterized protein YndB with AHSA1/START domain
MTEQFPAEQGGAKAEVGYSTQHDTFLIERKYAAPVTRVFNAWADPEAKSRWFVGPDENTESPHELDFRVGGEERVSGSFHDAVFSYHAIYQDIVPDERIIYTYDMHMDDRRISVSLATVEFRSSGDGTRLILTEHGVFLDDLDNVKAREQGTHGLLDKLEAELTRERTISG